MAQPTHPTRPELDFADGDFWGGDHHPHLTWARANAPLYWDGTIWGVTRYADVKAIATNPALYSSAGGIRPAQGPLPMMIDMDDPAHLKRRMLVNKGFTPRRVRESLPVIEQACTDILDAVCEQGEADLVHDIAAHLPMIMIGDALGVRPEDRATLLRWSDDLMQGLSSKATEEQLIAAGNTFGEYTAYCYEVIADRQANPGDDLMSILVHAEVDGEKLTSEDIIQESLLILIGGDETTRHVISGGIHQLLLHPEQRARLVEDPSLRPSAVEEMLRWVTPIKNMVRTATRDVELHGQKVEEGDELMLLYPSANRDEDVFDDPFRFDVARTPNEHVAFGFGPHFCLGASLARLEISVMLDHVLERLPDLRLADPDAPLAYRPANFVSGLEELRVVF